jgi:hypothetical protein
MEALLPYVSAFGVGGLVGAVVLAFVQSWLSRRTALDERRFRDKKEAYLNLLLAMHRSELDGTPEAAKAVGHCINVAELVASPPVRQLCARLLETNPLTDGVQHPDRPSTLVALKAAMRSDLGF